MITRETREGWPLLSVETEAHGESRSTHERGPSLVGSLGSLCRTRDFWPALDAQIGPVQNIFFFLTKETREGWPLLFVETEEYTHMKGVLPWLVYWARFCVGTRDYYPALAALIGLVQIIFFLAAHYFNAFVPQAGQAVLLGRLSPNICLW